MLHGTLDLRLTFDKLALSLVLFVLERADASCAAITLTSACHTSQQHLTIYRAICDQLWQSEQLAVTCPSAVATATECATTLSRQPRQNTCLQGVVIGSLKKPRQIEQLHLWTLSQSASNSPLALVSAAQCSGATTKSNSCRAKA
eukprot:18657-Heterococcus_DN1.PRE.1